MTEAVMQPAALLSIAIETFRSEILAALPPDRRYAGAMIANALEAAQRGLEAPTAERVRQLLDPIYGAGRGSIAGLARDVRSAKVDDVSTGELRDLLIANLRRELMIRNPRFLASRTA